METAESDNPGETGETGEPVLSPLQCGVDGVPSDGAPWGMVSLADSEVRSVGLGGNFAAGDHDGDGCSEIAFAMSGDDFDQLAGTTRIFSGPVLGRLDFENDRSVALVAEPDDWAYNPFTGDVNGDGLQDWLVAGFNIDDGLGGVYVVHGPATTSLALGSDFEALLLAQGDMTGREDHEAADLDGDGYDDLLIGISNYSSDHILDGGVFVIPGPVSGTMQIHDAETLLHSGSLDAALGLSTSAGGDTNGDGLYDVALASKEAYGYIGAVWVLESPVSGVIDVQDAGAMFKGETWSYAGDSISSGGDIDGDGYGDLLIGAWDYSDMSGRAYLVLGPFEGSHSLSKADGIVEAPGGSAEVGYAVSIEQDLDGDGRSEAVVGSPGADGAPNRGAAFVFYEPFEGLVDAFDEAEAVLYSEDGTPLASTGDRIAPAGDVNGDGFDDLYVRSAAEYLIFGGVR